MPRFARVCSTNGLPTAIAWPLYPASVDGPADRSCSATTTAIRCSAPTDRSFRTKGFPAPFLGGNVGQRFRERPLVAHRVCGAVLPFAVLEVGWLHEDAGAVLPGSFTVSAHVVNAHHHRVCES